MEKWCLAVASNCTDAAREAEFNEWYDKTHIPDVLETTGFIRATRYENIEPAEGEPKFLAIYEIETDDIDEFKKRQGDNIARKREAGRFSDLLVMVSRAYYKRLNSVSR